jgi:hypothetical protein
MTSRFCSGTPKIRGLCRNTPRKSIITLYPRAFTGILFDLQKLQSRQADEIKPNPATFHTRFTQPTNFRIDLKNLSV